MCRTDSAAPPRASPSSLVSTTPLKPTPSWNACAVVTASWPIIASTTNSTSSGCTASRMSAACCMSSASMPSRPAVSTTTTSCMVRRGGGVGGAARRTRGPAGVVDGVGRDTHRVADAVARLGREDVDPGLARDDRELVDRVGPLQVGGHEQRRVALRLEPAAELAGERRLTGALQTGEHDHRRRRLGVAQPAGLAAEDLDELLVDDLDDLLRRVQRLGDIRPAGALLDRVDEHPYDGQGDVGLEQRDADLARRRVDVGVGQPTLAPEAGEDLVQAVGERLEHSTSSGGEVRARRGRASCTPGY